MDKYALLVNTSDAIVTVRWKPSETTPGNWEKCEKAKRCVDSARKKKLPASCSSSLTVYAVDRIRNRIQQWRAWRASWVCETSDFCRP